MIPEVKSASINRAAFDVMSMRLSQARGMLIALEVAQEADASALAPEVMLEALSAVCELVEQAKEASLRLDTRAVVASQGIG